MALIGISKAYSKLKNRPKSYKAKDAPYRTGGNRGYYVAALPRPYPKNKPQRIIAALAEICGIKSGIDKSKLMTQMKECVTAENYKKAAGKA